MGEDLVFHYTPRCSAPGCDAPATYKIGAAWSDQTRRELKNYGLSCAAHCAELLQRAQNHRMRLVETEGESIGPVELFQFLPGLCDSQLPVTELERNDRQPHTTS